MNSISSLDLIRKLRKTEGEPDMARATQRSSVRDRYPDCSVLEERILMSATPLGVDVCEDLGMEQGETVLYAPLSSGGESNNQVPTTEYIRNIVLGEDANEYRLALRDYFDDVEDLVHELSFQVVDVTNKDLFDTTSIDGLDNLNLNVAADAFGESLITIRAWDTDGAFVDNQFQVTVMAVNDRPTTTGLLNITVDTNARSSVIDLFAAFDDVEDADAELQYSITQNSHPALFSSIVIDPVMGTLTLNYAEGAVGTAELTLRATDTEGLYVEMGTDGSDFPIYDRMANLPPGNYSDIQVVTHSVMFNKVNGFYDYSQVAYSKFSWWLQNVATADNPIVLNIENHLYDNSPEGRDRFAEILQFVHDERPDLESVGIYRIIPERAWFAPVRAERALEDVGRGINTYYSDNFDTFMGEYTAWVNRNAQYREAPLSPHLGGVVADYLGSVGPSLYTHYRVGYNTANGPVVTDVNFDADTDRLTTGVPLANDMKIMLRPANGSEEPGNLDFYEYYYVVNHDGDSFQLSETVNGEVVDFTSNGVGKVYLEITTQTDFHGHDPSVAYWRAYAEENLSEANKFGKETLAWLSPSYKGVGSTYIDKNFFRMQLETTYENSDGIVMYNPSGSSNAGLPQNSGWSEALAEFMDYLNSPTQFTVTIEAADPTTPTGDISGLIFNDSNENGSLGGSETGMAGWMVYVDENGNSRWDSGEATAVTDESGNYLLSNVATGNWTVRLHQFESQDVYRTTTFASQSVSVTAEGLSTADFGAFKFVQTSGNTATVYGTYGDDAIHWTAGDDHVLYVNGDRVDLDADLVTAIHFVARSGDDSITLTAGSGDDTLQLADRNLSLSSTGYTITAASVESLDITGGGGTDIALVSDTAGDDTFVGRPTYGRVFGPGYDHLIRDFGRIEMDSIAGGYDVAYFYDDKSDDVFTGRPEYSAAYDLDGTYYHMARTFDLVYAYATAGGNDVAYFYDSLLDDVFTQRPTYSRMYDTGFSFQTMATGYDQVFGYSTLGGVDTVNQYDSAGDDVLTANPTLSTMVGTSFFNSASEFEVVYAYATAGGNDVADLSDSSLDDILTAQPTYVSLTDADNSYRINAKDFERVNVDATAGGDDVAYLYDSASNDLFVGRHDYSLMRDDQSTYFNYTVGFDRVYAWGGSGGLDTAYLYDSADDDWLYAADNYAFLQTPAVLNYATAFDVVNAYAVNGGTNSSTVNHPLTMILNQIGTWNEGSRAAPGPDTHPSLVPPLDLQVEVSGPPSVAPRLEGLFRSNQLARWDEPVEPRRASLEDGLAVRLEALYLDAIDEFFFDEPLSASDDSPTRVADDLAASLFAADSEADANTPRSPGADASAEVLTPSLLEAHYDRWFDKVLEDPDFAAEIPLSGIGLPAAADNGQPSSQHSAGDGEPAAS